jgi:hypothetical protein
LKSAQLLCPSDQQILHKNEDHNNNNDDDDDYDDDDNDDDNDDDDNDGDDDDGDDNDDDASYANKLSINAIHITGGSPILSFTSLPKVKKLLVHCTQSAFQQSMQQTQMYL